jgi:hypothetical protein
MTISWLVQKVTNDEKRSASGRLLCVSPRFPTREMTNSWLVQKVTSDEKRVRQTLVGSATFPSEQVGDDELVARAESDVTGGGAAGGAVELVVIFARCLSVILQVLFSVYQTSFLSVIFTSFILGFIQGVVSLLFGQFYSVCYWEWPNQVYTQSLEGLPFPRRRCISVPLIVGASARFHLACFTRLYHF